MKVKTLSEAETARRRAVTGLRNLGRLDEAERYDTMSAREYASERGFEIVENPTRRKHNVARNKSRAQIEAELNEASSYIEELETRLDEIVGIASDGEEDEEEEDEDE